MSQISYTDIKNNTEIRKYIERSDTLVKAMGITEHSFVHVEKVAATAAEIMLTFGFSHREAELAQIAGFLHDKR